MIFCYRNGHYLILLEQLGVKHCAYCHRLEEMNDSILNTARLDAVHFGGS